MATHNSLFPRIFCAAGLAVAAAAAALPAPEPADCPAIDPPVAFSPSRGVRVFIDPVTGKIRPPTPAERRTSAEATARDRSARTYELQIQPDGTRIVELDDAFLMSVMATVNPDGTVSYRCVTGTPAPAASAAGTSK